MLLKMIKKFPQNVVVSIWVELWLHLHYTAESWILSLQSALDTEKDV